MKDLRALLAKISRHNIETKSQMNSLEQSEGQYGLRQSYLEWIIEHKYLAFAGVFVFFVAGFLVFNSLHANNAQAAIAYRSSGSFTNGTGSITVPYPTSPAQQANDICILAVESENQAISLTTANGFAEITSYSPQSAGTAGSNPATRLALYWKRAAGGDSSPVVADSGDHTTGQIHCFSGVITTGNPWDIGAGGNDSAANDTTGVIPGATTTVTDTLVLLFISTSFNGNSSAECGTFTNTDLTSITDIADNSSTSGLGGGHCLATGKKLTAGAYTSTTVTMANTTFKGAISLALAPELITISGTCRNYDDTADCGDTGDIAIAENTVRLGTTLPTVEGTWSFSIPKPAANAKVTIFIDGAATTDRATAYTVYSSGSITGVKLFKETVTIGSNQNTSFDGNSQYSYSNDNDVLYGTTSSCNGLSSSGYYCTDVGGVSTRDRMYIDTGDTFSLSASGWHLYTGGLVVYGTFTGGTSLFLTNTGTSTTCMNASQMPICISGGTFNAPTSLTSYQPAGSATIAAANYVGLEIKPSVNSSTATLGAGTFGLSGALTLGNGTNTGIIIDGTVNNPTINTTTLTVSASTQFKHGSGPISLSSSGTPFTLTGTFTDSTGTFTYNGTSATTITAATYGALHFLPAANNVTYTFAAGTTTVTGSLIVGRPSTFTGFTATAATNNTTLNVGSIDIRPSQTFTAHASNALTISADMTVNGTFNDNNSTVIFNNAAQASYINSSVTFHHLTINTPGKDILVSDGKVITIESGGVLTVNGSSGTGNEVTISSDTGTATWTINHQGTESITYLSVSWGACHASSTTITMGTGSTKDANSGACWDAPAPPITVSGTVYLSDGTTPDGTGYTLNISNNGGIANSTTSNGSGVFQFTNYGPPTAGERLTIWISGGSAFGTTIIKYGTSCTGNPNCTGISVVRDQVRLESKNGTSITSGDLDDCDEDDGGFGCGTSEIGFNVDNVTGDITIASGRTLHISTGTTFDVNAFALVTPALVVSGTLSSSGEVTVNSGGATGNGTISHTGGTFTHNVTTNQNFGGDSTWTFYNLVLTGASGTTTATGSGTITVTNNLDLDSGHTLQAGSKSWTMGGSGTSFIKDGTFTAGTSSFTYTSTSSVTVVAADYYDLVFLPAGSATFTLAAGTFNIARDLTIGDGNTIGTVSATVNDPAVNITRNLSIQTSSTLSQGTGTLTVGGDFENLGTFSGESGSTVVLNTTNTSVVTGDGTAFQNLTIATPGKTVQFQAGATFTVNGALNITGSSGNNVVITSTTGSTQWFIAHLGTESVEYVTLSYSGCDGSSATISVYNGTDNTNNGDCWEFMIPRTFSGTVQVSSGATDGTVRNLKWSKNGTASTVIQSTVTTGAFSFESTVTNGDIIHIWIDGETPKGTTVVKYGSSCTNAPNCTGLVVKDDGILLYNYHTAPITNADIALCDSDNGAGCSGDTDIEMNVTDSNLVVSAGNDLTPNGTYTPGGAVTTASADLAGGTGQSSITLSCTTTLNMESNNLSVGGSFGGCGTFTANAGQTTTFTGTANGHFIQSEAGNLQNVVLNSAGGTYVWNRNRAILGDLTVTAGTLANTDSSLTVSGGDVTGDGDISFTGTSTMVVEGAGSFGGNTDWDFNNLTFSGSSQTTSTTGSGGVVIAGTLTNSANHTLNAGSKTWTLSSTGTPLSSPGVFTASTSTIRYTGNGATIASSSNGGTSITYSTIEAKPNGTTPQILGTAVGHTINATNLIIGQGNPQNLEADTYDPTVNISSSMLIAGSATYTTGTGTLTFSGAGTPISRNGTFTATSGNTIIFSSDSGIAAISDAAMTGSNKFQHVIFNGTNDTFTAGVDIEIAGDLSIASGNTFASAHNITVNGIVGGGTTGAINHTAGTFTHSTTTSKNFGDNGNYIFNNLTLTGASGTTAANGSGSITINGVLTNGSSHTLNVGSKTWILTASGDPFVNNGNALSHSGASTFSYRGTSATNITEAAYHHLDLAPASGDVSYTFISGVSGYSIAGNFTLGGAGNVTANMITNEPAVDIAGSVTIGSGDTLSSTTTLYVGGAWTNNGTFTHNNSTVIFDGTGTNNITSGGANGAFYNITFNNAGDTWSLQDSMNVAGVLTITAGNLEANATTITLSGSGTPFVNNGTFTYGTSTVNYTFATGATVAGMTGSTGTNGYYNLSLGVAGSNPTSGVYSLNSDTAVNNQVTVGPNAFCDAIDNFDIGGNTLTLNGSGTPLTVNACGATQLGSGTVIYGSSSGATAISNVAMNGGNSYGNLYINGNGTFSATNVMRVAGDLQVNSGTLASASDIEVVGIVDGEGVINHTGGTFILTNTENRDFGGAGNWTFYNLDFEGNGGELITTVKGSGSVTVTNYLEISEKNNLNAGSKTFILTGTSQLPFVKSGGFTADTSTFVFAGAGSQDITSANYYNLTIAPGANSATHTMLGDPFGVANNFVVGNGTNTSVTVNAISNNPVIDIDGAGTAVDIKAGATFSAPMTMSVAGSWVNAGTFTHNNGTVNFDATSTGHTITDGGSDWYDIIFSGIGGGWSFADATTLVNDLHVQDGTLSGTSNITINGGTLTGASTSNINMTGGTVLIDGAGTYGSTGVNWTFHNLTFGDGTGTAITTITNSPTTTITGMLTIAANQTLSDATASFTTFSGSGTPFVINGTYNNTGFSNILRYTSSSGVTALASAPLTGTSAPFELRINGTGTFNAGVAIEARNALEVQAGTLAMGNNNLTVGSTSIASSGRLRVYNGHSLTQDATASTTILAASGTACIGANGASCTGTAGTITLGDLIIGNGTNTFTTNLAGTATAMSADTVTVNANTTFNAGTASTVNITGNGTVITPTGTFNTQTSTINFNSAGTTGTTIPALTYYNLGMNKASNTFTAGGAINVGNNFTITNGTFVAPSSTLTIVNDFTNNGNFNHNDGTVVFTPASSDWVNITGNNTTFNNLTNITPRTTLQFASGNTYTINGTWTVTGASGRPIIIQSTTLGAQWFVDLNGTPEISYANIKDSGCSNSVDIPTKGLRIYNLGNNGTCWKFILLTAGNGSSGGGAGSGGSGGGGGGVGGGSSQATATATIDAGSVTSVSVTNQGSGYTEVPAVCFSGGSGSGAAATATLTNGRVSAITVTNGGNGYQSAPTVTITSSPGGGSCGSGGGGGGSGGGGGGSP